MSLRVKSWPLGREKCPEKQSRELSLDINVRLQWSIGFYSFIQPMYTQDQQSARAAAKRLFAKVNYSGTHLESYEVSSLIKETYDFLKIPFKPTQNDLRSMAQVLDANRDGKVTLNDLETLAIQYLTGQGVLRKDVQDESYSRKSSEKVAVKKSGPISPQAVDIQVERQYGQKTTYYLNLTQEIFRKYLDQNNTIVIDAVADLLSETYDTLGNRGYNPSAEDCIAWMKLCDGNADGHVEYGEYQLFVLKCLERAGLNLSD